MKTFIISFVIAGHIATVEHTVRDSATVITAHTSFLVLHPNAEEVLEIRPVKA
jgi:hypothetical protein